MARKVLTPAEVADRLGCSVKTLANWRAMGKGPKYHRLIARGNPVRYYLMDLRAWLKANAEAKC
jgi:hypothetical protein